MTRPRLTIRRLMIAVAIVGLALGLVARMAQRASRFRVVADRYQQAWYDDMDRNGLIVTPMVLRHQEIEAKYRLAARFPWLPVAPDPPEPE